MLLWPGLLFWHKRPNSTAPLSVLLLGDSIWRHIRGTIFPGMVGRSTNTFNLDGLGDKVGVIHKRCISLFASRRHHSALLGFPIAIDWLLSGETCPL